MVSYPINVPRKHYGGAKPRLRQKASDYNRLARELEDYLNQRIAASDAETQTYLYPSIGRDTGIPLEIVRQILFGVDCGHNGLTVYKPPSGRPR